MTFASRSRPSPALPSEPPAAPASAPPFAEKLLTVLPPIEVAGRHIKRYHVTADPAGIAPEVQQAAYAILPELLPAPDGTPPATFVVLHRGGDDGAYLNAYSWVWDNVLHFRGAAAGQPVLGCPDDDPSHFVRTDRPWIGCVWELAPILHERDAWVRHVLARRAPRVPDIEAYLADSPADGTTGDRS
ncbi:hypothetical protein ACIBAH_18885 [Streptomyces sp. NPDC051445]|uniref:hypothetical protein n=1 Tax=unclassified Streptomyces TaxID=2593676 RepID=UPI0037B361ED